MRAALSQKLEGGVKLSELCGGEQKMNRAQHVRDLYSLYKSGGKERNTSTGVEGVGQCISFPGTIGLFASGEVQLWVGLFDRLKNSTKPGERANNSIRGKNRGEGKGAKRSTISYRSSPTELRAREARLLAKSRRMAEGGSHHRQEKE